MELLEVPGMSDAEDEEDVSPAKIPRMSGSEMYKPPTTEELNSLRETQNLFHSNLLRLQIEELLKEVTISEKRRQRADEYLHSLHDVIMSLPKTDKFKLHNISKIFDSVQIPFVMETSSVKGNMFCGPPADIQVVGSYLLHTILKQKMTIDLVLELPKECIQAKDHLNQRYLRKRASYLAYIAEHLKKHEMVSDQKFSYFEENPLKPILLLTPSGKFSFMTVQVHVSLGKERLKQDRFAPMKSNVRRDWFTGISHKEETDQLLPTPHYNSLILQDMLMVDHLKYLYEVLIDCEGIRNGIKLLKVWLRQRELDQGHGRFNGFILSMLVVHLLKIKKINKLMSSYQVVRNMFQYLGSTNWMERGISLAGNDVSEFHEHYEVVFVDPTGTLNLCANIPAAAYKEICYEARYSLETLNNKSISNSFESVFMNSVPFNRKYDHVLRIIKPWLLQTTCEKLKISDSLADHSGNAVSCALSHILSFLQRGLGVRIRQMGVKGCSYGTWEVDHQPPSWKQSASVLSIGLLLDGKNSEQIIDKGPAADSPEATEFRQFWGDKSELRRFQDGSICEAVVWKCNNKSEHRNIVEQICRHVFKIHCGLSAGAISYVSNQVENMLTLTTHLKQMEYLPLPGYSGTGDEINLRLIHSYNELCKQLMSLKELPLNVVSLQGISPALRYTEVYPPTQISINKNQVMKKVMKKIQVPDSDDSAPPFVHAIEVICHLEGSGKWPQEINALKRLKAAFHLSFAEGLERKYEDLTCVATQGYMDVFKDGFVFRITIAYHGEIAIMRTFTDKNGLVKTRNSPQAAQLEERTVHLPKLSSALRALSQKNTSYGMTCRLAKRWVNGQMLSRHVPEIVIELLCARLYTNPQPYIEPGSARVGFTRFLSCLSTFDFQENPFIVDLSGEMAESELSTIHRDFKTNRNSLPPMFIATSSDKTRSIWTQKQPILMILHRVKALSQISLENIEKKLLVIERGLSLEVPLITLFVLEVFTGSLSAYDVIIHLETKCIARKFETSQSSDNAITVDEAPPSDQAHILPVVSFDPVKAYVDELEASYSAVAMFFHNMNGGAEIGVLWRPGAFDLKEFKISNLTCISVQSKSNKVSPDVKTVIQDFEILGKGLVTNIELNTDKWKI